VNVVFPKAQVFIGHQIGWIKIKADRGGLWSFPEAFFNTLNTLPSLITPSLQYGYYPPFTNEEVK